MNCQSHIMHTYAELKNSAQKKTTAATAGYKSTTTKPLVAAGKKPSGTHHVYIKYIRQQWCKVYGVYELKGLNL